MQTLNKTQLKRIIGGGTDPNNYWYTDDGSLAGTAIGYDSPADAWSGSLYAADGTLIATGYRTVFDPTTSTGSKKTGKTDKTAK